MLKVEDVHAGYAGLKVLHGATLEVGDREIVALLGANGAGKTTLLRVISRLHPALQGSIQWDGENLFNQPAYRLAELGIAHVPDGRGILRTLTVMENLQLGALVPHARAHRRERLENVLALFPMLRDRRRQLAGTLSGGEQQMLAIGRALMLRPQLLLLDEPSLGLAPKVAMRILEAIHEINAQGTAVLLVEQSVPQALVIAGRGYVLETGRIVLAGSSQDLLNSNRVRSAYLGL